MRPKPKHLAASYACQFRDASVARVYRKRPPYPPQTVEIIAALCPAANRHVLELGAGTGEISIPLVGLVDSVTAVEPSAPMEEVAREQPGFDQVRWRQTPAEDFDYADEYGLIVCAQSLGWMDWGAVFPRMVASLHPEGSLVIVELSELTDFRWQDELRTLIGRYSTNQDFVPFDLIEGLIERDLFVPAGSRETPPMRFQQTIDDFVDSIHGRNGFSRDRMSPAAGTEFDAAAKKLLRDHHPSGEIRGDIRAKVTWGDPVPPTNS